MTVKKTKAQSSNGGGKISLNPSRTYKKKPSKDEIELNPGRTYKDKIEKPTKGGTNPRVAPSKRTASVRKKP